MPENTDEINFRKAYGHASLCNCIRRWQGKLIVTRRKCTCSQQPANGVLPRKESAMNGELKWVRTADYLPELHEVIVPHPIAGRESFVYKASDWCETYHPEGFWPGSSNQSRFVIDRILHYPRESAHWIHGTPKYWRKLIAPETANDRSPQYPNPSG